LARIEYSFFLNFSNKIFSATDDLSGVEIIKATLNDASINQNDVIVIDTAGEYILRIESKDKAGNPAVFESEFSIIL